MIAFFEGVAVLIYICLWIRSRNLQDLKALNMVDLKTSCFFVILRIGWAISLSIFILTKIKAIENHGNPYYHRNDLHIKNDV